MSSRLKYVPIYALLTEGDQEKFLSNLAIFRNQALLIISCKPIVTEEVYYELPYFLEILPRLDFISRPSLVR